MEGNAIWSVKDTEAIFGKLDDTNSPLKDYQQTGYKEYNQYLRNIPNVVTNDTINETIEKLTNYIKNYSTKRPICVFRYTKCKYFGVESHHFEKGFLSTSLFHHFCAGKTIIQPDPYTLYLKGFNALVFILVPERTNCVFYNYKEYEVLFPPGRILKICHYEDLKGNKLEQLKQLLLKNGYDDLVAHADHFFKDDENGTRFNNIIRVYFAEMLSDETPFGC